MNSLPASSRLDIRPWAPAAGARLAASLFVKARFPFIEMALNAERILPLELSFTALDGVVGWGGRRPAQLARQYAALRGLKYWSLEDGFLRSVGLGKARKQALSITIDDLGLHYDPIAPSRLETLILEGCSTSEIEQARDIRARLIKEQITKYNCDGRDALQLPRSRARKRILLVDQVAGDASTATYGSSAFTRMWHDALNQDADILIRDHPDVLAGFSHGILRSITRQSKQHLFQGRGRIDELLPEVDEVWTVSSQFGFEALIRGSSVVTYGTPFYAGWGLTKDRATDPASANARLRRLAKAPALDEIVAAALLRYPIYFDPIENKPVCVHRALDRLLSWKREITRLQRDVVCIGFSRHKHQAARLFLDAPARNVSFAKEEAGAGHAAASGTDTVIWGKDQLTHSCPSAITMEDGFIRSVGLGSAKVRPKSVCLDPVGIYYDATRPSLLENILNTAEFDGALLRRAAKLRELIVGGRISKYNVGNGFFDARSLGTDRPVALVAEQVVNDASLRYGMPTHATTLDLIAAVRVKRPDHFILLKRHPDVLSGNRSSSHATQDYLKYADHVLERPMDIDWSGISECHVATSQLGFEALLRGVETHCHGAPFYSNWGLTTDSVMIERRLRKLGIDELVAGALILYPLYRCWRTALPCEPEDVVREIISERDAARHRATDRWAF